MKKYNISIVLGIAAIFKFLILIDCNYFFNFLDIVSYVLALISFVLLISKIIAKKFDDDVKLGWVLFALWIILFVCYFYSGRIFFSIIEN